MSASAITDALIDNLSAASAIGGCQVGTSFDILETVSGCCAVVSLTNLRSNKFALGGQWERIYTHQVRLYVKDTSGNAKVLERDTQKLFDTSVCSLESDLALQGSVDIRELSELRGTHNIEGYVQSGQSGALYYVAILEVDTREWPGN